MAPHLQLEEQVVARICGGETRGILCSFLVKIFPGDLGSAIAQFLDSVVLCERKTAWLIGRALEGGTKQWVPATAAWDLR